MIEIVEQVPKEIEDREDHPTVIRAKRHSVWKNIQDILNIYTEELCKKEGIDPNKVRLQLAKSCRGETEIISGGIAEIIFRWPMKIPGGKPLPLEQESAKIRGLLKDAIRNIRTLKLIQPMAVERYAVIRETIDGVRKLIRSKIKNDESDFIFDLIERSRVTIQVSRTITVKDTYTGITVSTTTSSKENHFESGDDIGLWLRLSHEVMRQSELSGVPTSESEMVDSETPLLDAALIEGTLS